MSLVAAFLWRKSPQHSICTFVYDDETIDILLPPQIYFFSGRLFSFRKEAKSYITKFISELQNISLKQKRKIRVEYKIVFNVSSVPWIKASSESKFILNFFTKSIKKLSHVNLQPQLRNNLSGRSLKLFKRELRKMNLVSRKRGRHYEYYLWIVALHATSNSYEKKLKSVKGKLLDKFWSKPV